MTNLGALFVLHGLIHLPIVPAASISFVMAYLVSFSLQKFWTFADTGRDRMTGQMAIYFLVGVFGLVLNAVGMYMLVEVFLVWYLLAQIIMAASLAVMNYFLYRWIFRDREIRVLNGNRYKKILLAGYRPDKDNLVLYYRFLRKEIGLSTTEVEFRSVMYARADKEEEAEEMSRMRRKLDTLKRPIQFFKEVWRQAGWAEVVCVRGAAGQGLTAYLACRLRCKKYLLSIMDDYCRDQRRPPLEEATSVSSEPALDNYPRLRIKLCSMIEMFVAHGASRIFVPSEHLREVVTGWGIEEHVIEVFPEVVEPALPLDENLDP